MCKPDNGNSLLKKIKRVTIGEGLLRYCVRGWRGLRGAAGWGGAVRRCGRGGELHIIMGYHTS